MDAGLVEDAKTRGLGGGRVRTQLEAQHVVADISTNSLIGKGWERIQVA